MNSILQTQDSKLKWKAFYAHQRTVRQLIIEGKEHTPEYETAKAAMDAAVVKATKSNRA